MNSTWIEVHRPALRHNVGLMRTVAGEGVRLMAIVKANAYGHGMVAFAREAARCGVDWMGVSTFDEARALRQHDVQTPVLVLVGNQDETTMREAARHRLSLTVASREDVEQLCALSNDVLERLRVHLKIDTGMHRQGVLTEDVPRVLEMFHRRQCSPHVLEGVYTHFGAAENPADTQSACAQLDEFQQALTLIRAAGFTPIAHAAATSSAMFLPTAHFDMIRVGAGFYGIWPSPAVKNAYEETFPIKPTLTWKARIQGLKCLPRGSKVGYDFTATLERDSVLALCAVGYEHGYRRALSNTGFVLVGRARVPVIGRVAMCLTAMDVTDIAPVAIGDEVTLLGGRVDARISLDEFAQWSGGLNKEVISTIHPAIERRYVDTSTS